MAIYRRELRPPPRAFTRHHRQHLATIALVPGYSAASEALGPTHVCLWAANARDLVKVMLHQWERERERERYGGERKKEFEREIKEREAGICWAVVLSLELPYRWTWWTRGEELLVGKGDKRETYLSLLCSDWANVPSRILSSSFFFRWEWNIHFTPY